MLHSQSFLTAVTWFSCLSSLSLFLAIVTYKFRLEHQETYRHQKEKHYVGHFLRCLREPQHPVPVPVTSQDWQIVADVLIYLLRGTSPGERQEQLQKIARHLQVSQHIAPSLCSKSWVRRLHAVERLGFLVLPENKPLLQDALAVEKNPHVKAKLLWALSLVGGAQDALLVVTHLMQQEIVSSKFNEHLYRNFLEHLKNQGRTDEALSLCEQLIGAEQVPALFKRDLIEACGVAGFTPAIALIQQFYERSNSDPANCISCLRALGTMQADPEGTLIFPALMHPDWRIRAVAARAAASVKGAYEHLRHLLGDGNYHVRMNAAMALGSQGEAGRVELEYGLTSQDRFVRDICRYMLEVL